MAQPPSLKRISKDQYPDMPAWFEKLLTDRLNEFLLRVTNALSGNLTRDNCSQFRTTETFRTAQSAQITVTPNLGRAPVCVQLLQLLPTGLTSSWSYTWEDLGNGQVRIYFQGLPTDDTTRTVTVAID